MFVIGAIPVILAIMIAIPMITKSEIPFSASSPNDVIEFEYTRHQLKQISFGVTDKTVAIKSEILIIKNNRDIQYTVTKEGYPQPDKNSKIDEDKFRKLKALIKETGFYGDSY